MAMLRLCYMRLRHGYVMVMLHEVTAWLCYGYVTLGYGMAMLWLCYMRIRQGYVMVMLYEVTAGLCYGYVI